MPTTSHSPRGAFEARDLLLAAICCVAAFELFYFVLAQWAMSRIWEPWIVEHPVVGVMGPFVAIAFLSGLAVGALVAALVRTRSLHVAAWSGVAACVFSFGAAVVAGGVGWATSEGTVLVGPFVAGGLVLGALLVRKLWHA